MVLERRGEGWSEEVFPHVVMKRRPVERKARPAAKAAKADTAELTWRSASVFRETTPSRQSAPPPRGG